MDSLTASQVLCSICQERLIEEGCQDVEVVGTPCGHVFHKTCLASWFQKNEPQRRVVRNNPQDFYHGECPICFKPQWLKRCIRIYLSCDDADTTHVRALFDKMESELKDAKKEVADAKKEVAASQLELSQAHLTIKEQAAMLNKISKTTKGPVEINNNYRKKPASTSVLTTSAASSSTSVAGTNAKTRTSTSRTSLTKATTTARAAGVASKAKATSAATKPLPSVVKLRQHARAVARVAAESDVESVASSGSVYSPPQGVKAPTLRKAVMTRARARVATDAAATTSTSSFSGLSASGTIAPRNQRVRAGVAGNPFLLHR